MELFTVAAVAIKSNTSITNTRNGQTIKNDVFLQMFNFNVIRDSSSTEEIREENLKDLQERFPPEEGWGFWNVSVFHVSGEALEGSDKFEVIVKKK